MSIRKTLLGTLVLAMLGYCGAASARFIQSDPIGLRGGVNTYTYVGSSPLRFIDPIGLDPLDLFASRDDAAWDAAIYARRQAIKIKEYGGWIYRQGSCWTYNFIPGKDVIIPTPWLRGIRPANPRAVWHTHPPLYGTHYPDIFSGGDIEFAIAEGIPMYLYTPQGELKEFDPQIPSTALVPRIVPLKQPQSCTCP